MRLIVLVLLLSGCGTFQLAESVMPPPLERDRVECKDAALRWAKREEARARSFAAGFFLPVVGVPVAIEASKRDARAAFKGCMESRGYQVR